jgi:uncharacterized protein
MIIHIPRISEDGSRFTGEEPAGILDLANNRLVRVEGPIQYDLFAQVVSHELIVNGSLKVRLAVECDRCAEFFSTSAEDSSFLRAYALSEGTETVDLTEDIREDILVNLPPFPLCSPDCKGLCQQCGKNLNAGPCSCKPRAGGSVGWSELDKLKLD